MNVLNSLSAMVQKYGADPAEWEVCDTVEFTIYRGSTRVAVVFKNLPIVAKFCFSRRPANEIERHIYVNAVEEGLERFFSKPLSQIVVGGKIWTLFQKVPYAGRPDLIGEIVEPSEPPEEFYSSEYALIEYDGCNDWTQFANQDADFDRLVKFLGKWEITDLHQSNFGYAGNVVFIDYAGW